MQTSYALNAPTGLLGMPSEDWLKQIDTVIPTTAVAVGKFVVYDTTAGQVPNKAMLPSAAVQITGPRRGGFVILDPSREGGVDYAALKPTPVMRKGRIWVLTETAIGRRVHPFIRFTVNGGNTPGNLRHDADTDKAVEQTQIITVTEAGAGELVLVEIDLS